eukprot:s1214_g17.t1
MALVFVKTNDGGDVKPLAIQSGSVLSADHLATAPPSSKDEMREVRNEMRKHRLISTVNSLGLRFNRKGMSNSDMVNLIVEKNYAKLEGEAKKSSVASSSVETKEEDIPEEDIPTSGERNLMNYLAKNYKDVKGFHCGYYEGGAFHIFTPYGMYSPDVDDRDGIEFIRNNNCLILAKEDLKELMGDGDEVSEEEKDKVASQPIGGISVFKVGGGYGNLTLEEVKGEEAESSGDDFIYTCGFDLLDTAIQELETSTADYVVDAVSKVKLTIVPEGDKSKSITLHYNPETTMVNEIYNDIADITNIPLGGFALIDPKTMTEWSAEDYLKNFENEVGEFKALLRLKLKGGGVIRGNTDKKKETKSKSKKDIALEEMKANVNEMKAEFNVSATTIDAIANANIYATKLHDLATKDGDGAFQKLMETIPDGELDSITHFNTNRAEGKHAHIVKTLLKHNISDLEALMGETDAVYSTCYAVIELVVNMEFLSENGAFRYAQLEEAIKNEKKFRARANSKGSVEAGGDAKMD